MSVVLKGVRDVKNKLIALDKATTKNRSIAIRVGLFKARKALIADIKKGTGKPLSFMARAGTSGLTRRKPFTGLYSTRQAPSPGKGVVPVRYHEVAGGKQFELGFTDTRKEKLSKSWKYILGVQQAGFSTPVSKRMRAVMRKRGQFWKKKLGNKSRSKLTKVFFLKKETTMIKTPPRPMIDPFWMSYKAKFIAELERDFDKKMRGEKI